MSEPSVAQKAPFVMELEAGKYYWCSCGQSSKQPFCDGTHKGTDFRPVLVELAEAKKVALCGCKHSAGVPFCDGKHRDLA